MKILVAMSGGVDSSVAAHLLKEQGHEVAGATIRTWASEDCPDLNTRACCSVEGVTDARSVARAIDIPYYVFNFEKEFKAGVVDYFTREYMRGRTPNPCIVCNQKIKFRLFLKRARALGMEAIATGHYASVCQDEGTGRYLIQEGVDKSKDQSYVLFALRQDELKHLALPLGSYRKEKIREIARGLGLCVSDKPDSQEICFIPSNDYGQFLEREVGAGLKPATTMEKGLIRDEQGNVLGNHRGYYHFTVGQRRGLGIAHREALYVTRIDGERNEVIVGPKEAVRRREFWVGQLNWMKEMNGAREFRAEVKIRSNFTKAPATVEIETVRGAAQTASSPLVGEARWGGDQTPHPPLAPSQSLGAARPGGQPPLNQAAPPIKGGGIGKGERVKVTFDEPQEAITPGQAAVFYEGDYVIGGGWIDSVEG